MPQDSAPKLTKKQRKGLAFRQKIRKNKPEPADVPEADDIDLNDNDELVTSGSKSSDRRKNGNAINRRENVKAQQSEGDVKPIDAQTKKRKRADSENEPGAEGLGRGDTSTTPKQKKRKQKELEENEEVDDENDGKKDSKSEKHKPRYILFVGNLKYTTTKDAIQAHFAHCNPPPTIRLLTPKSSSPSSLPSKTKSKGCAFLEFPSPHALQSALKQHHSTLDGRQINVELTAGGGGKSVRRLEKVRGRNVLLDGQRKKHSQKSPSDTVGVGSTPPDRPQRHSSTSGSSVAPSTTTTKRTWSIPEAGDEGGKTSEKRGAKKRKGVGGPGKNKDLGTGVNAIPVG